MKRFGLALGILVAGMLAVYGCGMYRYFPDRAPYVYQGNNAAARWVPRYEQWMRGVLAAVRGARGG